MNPADGFRSIPSQELTGQALAWAVCEVYGVPAAILDGAVQVEVSSGYWLPFNADDMLRSLVLGHVFFVVVPNELLAPTA